MLNKSFILKQFAEAKTQMQQMYKDSLTVYSASTQEDEDGVTSTMYSATPLYDSIPCKVSYKPKPDRSDSLQTFTNAIDQQIRIHCAPELNIKKGDKFFIEVKDENGAVLDSFWQTTNSKPQKYISHQEILFTILQDA